MNTIVFDLFLMFFLFFICVILFFALQVCAFRWLSYKGLSTHFIKVILLTVILGAVIGFAFFHSRFSSDSTFFTALLGALGTFIFFAGFYSFAGPICADRSLSAHMAILVMRSHGGRMLMSDLQARYSQDVIFSKRFGEIVEAGIFDIEKKEISITPKGKFIAGIYESFIRILKLKENF